MIKNPCVGENALVMKTPDMADALRSLEEAIRAGPATADLAEVAKIEHLHRERLVRQLDLQMQEQARSAQREIRQATTLSLLSGICEALAQRAEAEPILARVLGSTLAGLGLSAGLILAREEGGAACRSAATSANVWPVSARTASIPANFSKRRMDTST